MTNAEKQTPNWDALDEIQKKIIAWQDHNFPGCQEWEVALGVCEEAGELAQCLLKLHRGIRPDEFTQSRLRDAVGDIVIYLFGICGSRDWKLSSVLESTAERVLSRTWRDS